LKHLVAQAVSNMSRNPRFFSPKLITHAVASKKVVGAAQKILAQNARLCDNPQSFN
jgi:hypothetical protein